MSNKIKMIELPSGNKIALESVVNIENLKSVILELEKYITDNTCLSYTEDEIKFNNNNIKKSNLNQNMSIDDIIELLEIFIFLYKSRNFNVFDQELMKSWEKLSSPNVKAISNMFDSILKTYGWDINNDENLKGTGERIAKSWKEIFKGSFNNPPKIKAFDLSKMDSSDTNPVPVFVGPIEFKSTCSHHFLPIVGDVYIEYRPVNEVIGLSKIPRLAKYLAARPMIQELYTKLLAKQLHETTKAPVAVYVVGKHFCSFLRGVEDHSSKMHTSWFIDYSESEKNDFMNKVNR